MSIGLLPCWPVETRWVIGCLLGTLQGLKGYASGSEVWRDNARQNVASPTVDRFDVKLLLWNRPQRAFPDPKAMEEVRSSPMKADEAESLCWLHRLVCSFASPLATCCPKFSFIDTIACSCLQLSYWESQWRFLSK